MTTYECLSLVASFLTLAALSLTLFVLWGYARDTKTLARVAVEQLPRPFVVLKRSVDSSGEAVLAGETTSLIGDAHYGSHLIFMNIGTVPAVNCQYHVRASDEPKEDKISYQLPEIEPGNSFDTHHTLNSLPSNAVLSIEYESVTGSPYRNEMTVKGRIRVGKIR